MQQYHQLQALQDLPSIKWVKDYLTQANRIHRNKEYSHTLQDYIERTNSLTNTQVKELKQTLLEEQIPNILQALKTYTTADLAYALNMSRQKLTNLLEKQHDSIKLTKRHERHNPHNCDSNSSD